MGRVELDTWFFSDQRYRGLIAEERLILLLVAVHDKSTVGVLSSKSGFVHETVKVITTRLIDSKLIGYNGEFFCLLDKEPTTEKGVAVKQRDNDEYNQIVEKLYEVINKMAPERTKKFTPKTRDYDAIRLMVEVDKVPPHVIIGILQIYQSIPFWGEKLIVQSASSLRKHWVRIYESAQKHYNKTRIVKI